MKTDVLHKLAKSRKIDMATIANGMNCSVMQAYRYLNFPRRLKVDQVIRLSAILNKSPNLIFAKIAQS